MEKYDYVFRWLKKATKPERHIEEMETFAKKHPIIFMKFHKESSSIVKYDENDRTASYTYTDLLTRTVEVDVFNGEEYSPLLPPLVVESKRRKMKEQLV